MDASSRLTCVRTASKRLSSLGDTFTGSFASGLSKSADVSFGVEGASSETVGAARIELIGGGKTESTDASKLETVGTYMVNAKESLTVDAKGIVLNIAGTQKQSISGSHSLSADGPVVVNAPKLKLKGSGTITLTCGPSKVVVKSGGIFVEGAASVTIEGGQVDLDENALGTWLR